MADKAAAQSITLTGEMLDWGELPTDELTIAPNEVDAYERDGYGVAEIGGHLLAFKSIEPNDGDITIQARLDAGGRSAVSGRNANLGYSGYFAAYVYLGGKRRALVDFRKLFQNDENRYTTQYLKQAAETAVRDRIVSLAGSTVRKVPRGFAFYPEAVGTRSAAD